MTTSNNPKLLILHVIIIFSWQNSWDSVASVSPNCPHTGIQFDAKWNDGLTELRFNSKLHNIRAQSLLILFIKAVSQTGQELHHSSEMRLPINPQKHCEEKKKKTLAHIPAYTWDTQQHPWQTPAVPFRLQSRWLTCSVCWAPSTHYPATHPAPGQENG